CLLSIGQAGLAQEKKPTGPQGGLDKYLGDYHAQLDSTSKFSIRKENDRLMLVVPGQGQAPMDWVSGNQFRPEYVRPEALIDFVPDSSGRIGRMLWNQKVDIDWIALDKSET